MNQFFQYALSFLRTLPTRSVMGLLVASVVSSKNLMDASTSIIGFCTGCFILFLAFPSDRIGRIGDYGIKRLIIPVFGVGQCVAMGNIKVIVVDVVQKHIDTAEVIDSEVDFLPEEPLPDIYFAENLEEFEQQRAGTAGRVIDLVHLFFTNCGNLGKQLTDLLRGEKFTAGLACIGSVHGHQKLIGVAESVDGVVVVVAQLQAADAFMFSPFFCRYFSNLAGTRLCWPGWYLYRSV